MPRYFCTYFDINYLLLGMTMFRSLRRHCPEACLYVLCLDDETFEVLENTSEQGLVPIRLSDIEHWDNSLLEAKGNRSRIEYYFTLTPYLCLYVLDRYEPEIITYLDADVFFFSNPELIFTEMGNNSILLTEHRFSEHLKQYEIYGRFNVQFESFRTDKIGRACLDHWKTKCYEYCGENLEKGRYADQKYLDEWPDLFEGVVVSRQSGAGLAVWNVHGCEIREEQGNVLVDEQPLIFFHYHGFKYLGGGFCKTGLGICNAHVSDESKRILFGGYVVALQESLDYLRALSAVKKRHSDLRGSRLRYFLSAIKYGDLYYAKRQYFN